MYIYVHIHIYIFIHIHIFAILLWSISLYYQLGRYVEMLESLEKMMISITGFEGCSLQPTSGASGEYAGLLAHPHGGTNRQGNIIAL